MKIAIFTDSFFPGVGGTERAVFGLASSLCKSNEVMVCCPEYQFQYDDNNFPFRVLRAASITLTNTEVYALPEISVKFKNALEKFAPDVIHCHTVFSMAQYALKYGKKHNIPVIFTVHTKFKTSFSSVIKSKLIVNAFIKEIAKKLKKASKVCTVSNDMINELNSYGYKEDIKVVRNGAMFEKVENLNALKNATREYLNIPKDQFVFLFVGRIVRIKNLEFTVNALKIVKEKYNNFKMIMVGSGPDLDFMKQYVCDQGLKDNFLFAGQVTNKSLISNFYSCADLFLFPSIFDNDPLTVVEAAIHSVPSLTLENTGSSERIVDNVSGFICKNDLNEFANRILEIIKDKSTLKSVGENAEKMIPKTWEDTSNEYLKIYNETIANFIPRTVKSKKIKQQTSKKTKKLQKKTT